MNGLDDAPEARARVGQLALREGDVFTEAAYDRDAREHRGRARHDRLGDRGGDAAGGGPPRRGDRGGDLRGRRRGRAGGSGRSPSAGPPRCRATGSASRCSARSRPATGGTSPGSPRRRRGSSISACSAASASAARRSRTRTAARSASSWRCARRRSARSASGPGIGFQAIRWDTHALFCWQHRNFFGELRRVATETRLGYAWLPNPWTATKEGTIGLVAARVLPAGRVHALGGRERPPRGREGDRAGVRLLRGAAEAQPAAADPLALDAHALVQPRGVRAVELRRAVRSRRADRRAGARELPAAACASSPTCSSGSPGTAATPP